MYIRIHLKISFKNFQHIVISNQFIYVNFIYVKIIEKIFSKCKLTPNGGIDQTTNQNQRLIT
jgi:hypothetical protein